MDTKKTLSRNLQFGEVVTLRGNKYIRCSGKAKPAGVIRREDIIRVRTLDDEVISVKIPFGIQIYGEAQVKVG